MISKNLDYLVTGGNGYIGSHMCKLLANKGLSFASVDNHSTSPKNWTHQYGKSFDVDLLNAAKLNDLIKEIQPKYIFHFAGSAIIGESEREPLKYYENNFAATLNLITSFINNGGRKFIFSSTCATYGIPNDQKNISENLKQNPINAYGNSKLLVEWMLKDLARLGSIDVAFLRYFNVAGSDPKAEIGENHEPETHLIPNLISSYLTKSNETFAIYGDQYPTDDGTCVRDYIHVEDLVLAHFMALDYIKDKEGDHAFNLGMGRGYSVKEVLSRFESIIGQKMKTIILPARVGDPPYLVADATKAKNELGFSPVYQLEDCIKHSLNYFKKSHQ